jgi:hypothetical protein
MAFGFLYDVRPLKPTLDGSQLINFYINLHLVLRYLFVHDPHKHLSWSRSHSTAQSDLRLEHSDQLFFDIPGAMLGSVYSDWLGPKMLLQMAWYVMHSILSLGEDPDNIGLLASKTCATGVRVEYYAIAAANGVA